MEKGDLLLLKRPTIMFVTPTEIIQNDEIVMYLRKALRKDEIIVEWRGIIGPMLIGSEIDHVCSPL